METIWIIGCGRFGRIALERLASGRRITRFVVVEPKAEHFPQPRANVEIVRQDGVAFLKQHLGGQNSPNWIIPALPVHLAALWIMADAAPVQIRRCDPPEDLEKLLPNPMFGHTGDIYTSMADFMCPDNCPEPGNHCPATGKKRVQNLFEWLENLEIAESETRVIRSHQLAPGVGGYKPESLLELKQKVSQKPGKYLIATACRCHGVITPVSMQA